MGDFSEFGFFSCGEHDGSSCSVGDDCSHEDCVLMFDFWEVFAAKCHDLFLGWGGFAGEDGFVCVELVRFYYAGVGGDFVTFF